MTISQINNGYQFEIVGDEMDTVVEVSYSGDINSYLVDNEGNYHDYPLTQQEIKFYQDKTQEMIENGKKLYQFINDLDMRMYKLRGMIDEFKKSIPDFEEFTDLSNAVGEIENNITDTCSLEDVLNEQFSGDFVEKQMEREYEVKYFVQSA